MQITDMEDLLLWSFITGFSVFIALRHRIKDSQRASVVRWCVLIGFAAAAYFGLHFYLGERIPPSKATMGLGFVGLPALLFGVLMFAENILKGLKAKYHE